MLIVTHIVFALLSLVQSTTAVVIPSRMAIRTSYALSAATLASGSYLVWSTHAALVSSCTTGLMYLAVIGALTAVAKKRLSY